MHDDTEEFRNRERAAAVLHLRSELRKTHKDVRMNSRICKHCWQIIVAVEERKVNLSLSAVEQKFANGTSKTAKRTKRSQPDGGSGDEETPTSPKTSKKRARVSSAR